MKKSAGILLGFLPFLLLGLTVEEADRFPVAKQKTSTKILNLTFEKSDPATKRLSLSGEFVLAPDEGCNGTTALKVTRNDPGKYSVSHCKLGKLPFSEYTLTFMMRGKDLKRITTYKGWFSTVGIEFYRNGKWLSGKYLKLQDQDIPGKDWKQYTLHFKPAPGNPKTILSLYIVKGSTGTVWMDDLAITSSGQSVGKPILLQPSTGLTIWGSKGGIVFKVPRGCFKGMSAIVELAGRKKLVAPGPDHCFSTTFNNLPKGPAALSITLVDSVGKEKLYTEKYPIVVRTPEKAPANAAVLDKFGRLIVDGKPFMPIGIYGYPTKTELDALTKSGFNTMLCYSAIRGKNNLRTLKDIKALMDDFQSRNLKVIFNLKDQILLHPILKMDNVKGNLNVVKYVVENMRSHSALLAWYLTDELDFSQIDKALELRGIVSALDPWHPTYSITYRPPDMPDYAISGDIIGMDPYPIKADSSHSSIRTVKTFSDLCVLTGQPFWMVPQAFGWGVYASKSNVEKYRKSHIPTQDELDAMALLCAIRGARGFIFYSSMDVLIKSEKLIPGSSKAQWKRILKMVGLLKWLEPYIMTEKGPSPLKINADQEDQLYGAVFRRNDKDVRVVLVGVDRAASGTFTIPGHSNLHSKFGRTRNLGNGKYQFTVNGVQADILY